MEDVIHNIDEYSGNPIRLTDNDHKDDDILSPQLPEPLAIDPATGLPKWWNLVKETRGDIIEHA